MPHYYARSRLLPFTRHCEPSSSLIIPYPKHPLFKIFHCDGDIKTCELWQYTRLSNPNRSFTIQVIMKFYHVFLTGTGILLVVAARQGTHYSTWMLESVIERNEGIEAADGLLSEIQKV